MVGVNVKSEIKPLKKVLLHRPGKELLNLTPETLAELLFDDIPFLKIAVREHDAFAKTLSDNGTEVVYLENLMAEVLDLHPELRERFLRQFIDEAGIRSESHRQAIFEFIDGSFKKNIDLVLKTMEGVKLSELSAKGKSLAEITSDAAMEIAPMPNLYFTRDPFAMIGTGVSINKMYSVTRQRETIFGDYIFKYHPDFKTVTRLYNRDDDFHMEGGDILNLTDTVVAIGISQRTEPDAIETIAKNIFSSPSPVKTILAFGIPNSRAFMHLDTVFTQIDFDKFTVHPGIFGQLMVYEITSDGKNGIHIKPKDEELRKILCHYTGRDVEMILCGGGDKIAAAREQWNDGSNTLCVRPGTVIAYDRNEITNDLLRKSGVTVLEIASSEISRGRGGPRCMTMPIWRED
jgi:arginine deiminase